MLTAFVFYPDSRLQVFVPSYGLLDTLVGRWRSTGMWKKLGMIKSIVTEPRGSAKADFETGIKKFFRAVDRAVAETNAGRDVRTARHRFTLCFKTMSRVSLGSSRSHARRVMYEYYTERLYLDACWCSQSNGMDASSGRRGHRWADAGGGPRQGLRGD